MIDFDCPGCRAKLQVADEHAGKLMRCPNCQHTATIPSPEANAVTAEPVAPVMAAPPPAPAAEPSQRRERDDEDDDRRRRRRDDEADDDRARPKKAGMSVALVLVIVGISVCVVFSLLIALMVPAVQSVRTAAARTQSMNNLRQIGLAFHSFHDANKRLPFNGADGGGQFGYSKKAVAGDMRSGSWGFQVLPFVDQGPMFAAADRRWPVVSYMCPGRSRPPLETTNGGGAWSDYFYNNYINSAEEADNPSVPDLRRTLVSIRDGTSNTILAGHGNIDSSQYALSGNVTLASNIFQGGTLGTMRAGNKGKVNPGGAFLQRDSATPPGVGSWGGPFAAGGLMVMADGSARIFPYTTNNLSAFLTPDGGEEAFLVD